MRIGPMAVRMLTGPTWRPPGPSAPDGVDTARPSVSVAWSLPRRDRVPCPADVRRAALSPQRSGAACKEACRASIVDRRPLGVAQSRPRRSRRCRLACRPRHARHRDTADWPFPRCSRAGRSRLVLHGLDAARSSPHGRSACCDTDLGRVQRVPFRRYVAEVMASGEWPSRLHMVTLEAGAVATKQYAWYYAMNGHHRPDYRHDGRCYDVRDDTSGPALPPGAGTPERSPDARHRCHVGADPAQVRALLPDRLPGRRGEHLRRRCQRLEAVRP